MKKIDEIIKELEVIEKTVIHQDDIKGISEQVSILSTILKDVCISIKSDRRRVREAICGI
jgi:hypothetical protein